MTEEIVPAFFVLQVPPVSNIIYDIRLPPSTLRSAPYAPFYIAAYSGLDAPFAPSRPSSIRIMSKDFPWALDVDETTAGAGVTCREVLDALYDSLQTPLADHEWGFSSDDLRQRILRAWRRRGPLHSGNMTLLKRVDLLGGRCKLQGFCRDEDFVVRRSFPGARSVTDTWIARFMH
ncbi:hypothetical protein DFH09DRAFT_930108 [Mycena vulgaris]|nr:hypothetical protein DFH09DRAFT_930108 [Mycena vulgaris]